MRLNKNILVTGGAGYIGSHACKRLAEIGYNPITVDDLSTGWRDAVKFGPFEKVDIRKYDELGAVFKKYEPQGVMHLRDPAKWQKAYWTLVNTGKIMSLAH